MDAALTEFALLFLGFLWGGIKMGGFSALLVEEVTEALGTNLRTNLRTGKKRKKTAFTQKIVQRCMKDLPAGELLIQVLYSSLNYKDALSAYGNKQVTREYPHTPGIDAAGVVVTSQSEQFQPGDEVIVSGYDLGMNTAGGFGQYIRVPAQWAVARPDSLSLKESMILGTAGFTAALCVNKLQRNGLEPELGPVLVTGASGGVGSVAVALLAQLGFAVTACTGKADQRDFLLSLGAAQVIDRSALIDEEKRPLLKERWAGAVDVVGGDILFNVLKSLQYGGSVACCGLVAAPTFEANVFPFIMRGVNLLGVDSAYTPIRIKSLLWKKLSSDWKLQKLTFDKLLTEISLAQLADYLALIYRGETVGRVVLDLRA